MRLEHSVLSRASGQLVMLFTALALAVGSGAAEAQVSEIEEDSEEPSFTREITKAPEEPPIMVREDGTTVLTGTALPDFIAIQNFFINAYLASRTPARWRSFLARLDVPLDSEAADALLGAAGEILEVANNIQLTGDHVVQEESILASRRLGVLWRQVRAAVKRTNGAAVALEDYLETKVRRESKLVISPDSAPDMVYLEQLQREFSEEVVR